MPGPVILSTVLAGIQLAETIAKLVDQGLSDEEILHRMADPNGVGKDLLVAIRGRKSRIDDFKRNG